MAGMEKNYYKILDSLKEKIRLARQRTILAANKELLKVYWEIGNTILKQQKEQGWGAKVIDKLAADLKQEFPDMKGLSVRNIKYMRAFAEAWPQFMQQPAAQIQDSDNQSFTIVQQAAAQLPWGHHQLLLDKLRTAQERDFYTKKAIENGWSRNMMAVQIENQLHLRQGNAITNFELRLSKPHSDLAQESIKNPYVFDFLAMGEKMHERDLENALIQHIKKFMLELGRGFAYVGNQYNMKVEGDDFYLDLLFFNYQLNCFVVFELKVGEFEPEFAGKLNFYINTIDAQIKLSQHKPTIGVLLCKTPNKTVVKYALKGIDTPMGVAEYEFTNALPKQLKGEMPTIQELEEELEKEVQEFKVQQNPVYTRLQAIKEKLKEQKSEEIQTSATFPILLKLYNENLRPLYLEILEKLTVFDEDFHSKSFGWNTQNMSMNTIEQLDELWTHEEKLRGITEVQFFHNFYGLKKAGTECLSEYITLKLEIREFSYDFVLGNHNNGQAFLKKLYHQPINKEDQQQIIDLMMSKIIDKIEWIVEVIKSKQEK